MIAMVFPRHLPNLPLANVKKTPLHHSIYHKACAIFRALAMAIQYSLMCLSVTVRHWRWLPNAKPLKFQTVPTWNIASLQLLPQCFKTALRPFPKELYRHIGPKQGFRITHDVIYRPASGLCLGMSLTFLSQYLAGKGSSTDNLLAAARLFRRGGTEMSVRVQAIYDTLMGIQGQVYPQDVHFFAQVLKRIRIDPHLTQKKELLVTIQAFINLQDPLKSLRQFVLDDLERQGINITPDLYALILELGALWDLRQHPNENKNDAIHNAIIQLVANDLQLEMVDATRLQGKFNVVAEQLRNVAPGNYLIQFPIHTLAFIKSAECTAIWEPNEGLALLAANQQQEALAHLLHYYASHDLVSVKVLSIK